MDQERNEVTPDELDAPTRGRRPEPAGDLDEDFLPGGNESAGAGATAGGTVGGGINERDGVAAGETEWEGDAPV